MNAGECVRRLFFVIFAPDSQQESSPLSGRKSTQATVRICGASSIASTNDNSISGQQLMDRCSQTIVAHANTIKKGFGDYLYFRFAETTEIERGIRMRGIAAPKRYMLSDAAKALIKEWVLSNNEPLQHLRVEESGLCVEIEKKNYKQIRYHNFWTSRPPRVYSETDNPIYNVLSQKLSQIEGAPEGTYRIIFLSEIGSRTLDELGAPFPNVNERNATAEKIIRRFLSDKKGRVDAVVVVVPKKDYRLFSQEPKRSWKAVVFWDVETPGLLDSLRKIEATLPLPRFNWLSGAVPLQAGRLRSGAARMV
ncbi:hypothetical protein [Bradyrhizobium japonicum]|uniref:hypothetical protein n=1 Tax=Bradyrhizobium japonicum TaxID=375 RepID=UPI003B675306